MNVIEDRRIDSFVYKMAPGYRPYYDAMYKKYFFNSDVEKNLRFNPEWRKPTVENYVNWILMMFSPHFSPKALPGLQKMVNLIDLSNIRRFDSPRMKYVHEWSVDHTDSITMGLYNAPAFSHEQFPLLWTFAKELMISIL
jgi:hypothetical protein